MEESMSNRKTCKRTFVLEVSGGKNNRLIASAEVTLTVPVKMTKMEKAAAGAQLVSMEDDFIKEVIKTKWREKK